MTLSRSGLYLNFSAELKKMTVHSPKVNALFAHACFHELLLCDWQEGVLIGYFDFKG